MPRHSRNRTGRIPRMPGGRGNRGRGGRGGGRMTPSNRIPRSLRRRSGTNNRVRGRVGRRMGRGIGRSPRSGGGTPFRGSARNGGPGMLGGVNYKQTFGPFGHHSREPFTQEEEYQKNGAFAENGNSPIVQGPRVDLQSKYKSGVRTIRP